jgi:hypothetical protein
MDDSAMYTGVDGEGMFGNEELEATTKAALEDQKHLLSELTPKLQEIVDMLDGEKALVMDFIAGYVDSTTDSEDLFRAELKAAGLYRKYIDGLKTKFVLALKETTK